MSVLKEDIGALKSVRTQLDHTVATATVASSLMSMEQAVMVSRKH